jgi:UDP-2,3-diacylglucosamine hydrolase
LYILGDLFEYWLGDDAGIPAHARFIDALAQLSQHGCGLTVMLGNRDFLLGEEFANAATANLVTQNQFSVQLGASKVVLMHGDTLCTDDTDYQKFRSLVRQPAWQENFLGQTIQARVQQAQALRKASVDANTHKQSTIMDVNADAVSNCVQDAQCCALIHGHTHRPAIHPLPSLEATRYVVGDWHPKHAKYLRWSATGFEMSEFC